MSSQIKKDTEEKLNKDLSKPKGISATKAKAGEPLKDKRQLKAKIAPKLKKTLKNFEGRNLADIVVAAAAEHKAIDPILLDLRSLSSVADWFFIVSAENPRQMSAIADKISVRAKENGVRTLGKEGNARVENRWVLVDLGEVVVHIFNHESRSLYDLEGLWTDAPRCHIKEKRNEEAN